MPTGYFHLRHPGLQKMTLSDWIGSISGIAGVFLSDMRFAALGLLKQMTGEHSLLR